MVRLTAVISLSNLCANCCWLVIPSRPWRAICSPVLSPVVGNFFWISYFLRLFTGLPRLPTSFVRIWPRFQRSKVSRRLMGFPWAVSFQPAVSGMPISHPVWVPLGFGVFPTKVSLGSLSNLSGFSPFGMAILNNALSNCLGRLFGLSVGWRMCHCDRCLAPFSRD